MRLKLGEIPVVVSSVEAVRDVMKTHDIVFATRPITKSIEALFFGSNDVRISRLLKIDVLYDIFRKRVQYKSCRSRRDLQLSC
ncbi:hypothetical protein KSP40_PGU019545 [Platanthera guangdongensis]|uniref:CBS domain-containing protein n=1 Tax=Platanthera guangdongensis TaxID=2320717 RepID=A0ABR2MEP3_9ASPA